MSENNLTEEYTLKDLILKVQEYIWEVLRKWWVIILMILFVSIYFLNEHYNHKINYNTSVKYIIEGNTGGSAFGGLLGSFGVKRGGSNRNNPYTVKEIAMSTRLAKSILGQPFNKSNIANSIIETYELDEKWGENNDKFKNFRFKTDSLLSLSTRVEKDAFQRLKRILWGSAKDRSEALLSIGYNEDSGVYSLYSKTLNEQLSVELANSAFKYIKGFFEEELLYDQLRGLESLRSKADSLNKERIKKNYELANFEDSNRANFSSKNSIRKVILQQDVMTISVAYNEIIKNREISEISLKDNKPLFLVLDLPMTPLRPIVSVLWIALIKSILVGGFLAVLFIIGRKAYSDIMSK